MAAFNSNSNKVIQLDKYKKEANWLKRLLILNITLTTLQLATWLLQELRNAGF